MMASIQTSDGHLHGFTGLLIGCCFRKSQVDIFDSPTFKTFEGDRERAVEGIRIDNEKADRKLGN